MKLLGLSQKKKKQSDLRTTFYNPASIKLLKNLSLIDNLNFNEYSRVDQIEVFGVKGSSHLCGTVLVQRTPRLSH